VDEEFRRLRSKFILDIIKKENNFDYDVVSYYEESRKFRLEMIQKGEIHYIRGFLDFF
jgi:hypothetical protein